MATRPRFDDETLAALARGKILGIRAGDEHRFIGIWMVVVERRLFVRSWDRREGGWLDAFAADPRGAIRIGEREIPVRAARTRSERLKAAVDRAYATKYDTKGSVKYVRGLRVPSRRDTTTELMPR
ncbi:MAG TPA: DUF2255 family protein [Thermoanaerobaculia bacterium]